MLSSHILYFGPHSTEKPAYVYGTRAGAFHEHGAAGARARQLGAAEQQARAVEHH